MLRFLDQVRDLVVAHRVEMQPHALAEHALHLLLDRRLRIDRQIAGRRQLEEAGTEQHALPGQRALPDLGRGQHRRYAVKIRIGGGKVGGHRPEFLDGRPQAFLARENLLCAFAVAPEQPIEFPARLLEQIAYLFAVLLRLDGRLAGLEQAGELTLELQDLRDEHVPRPHRHAALPVAARLRVHALAPPAPGVDHAVDAGFARQQPDDDLVASIKRGGLAPDVARQAAAGYGVPGQPRLRGEIGRSDAIAQVNRRGLHGRADRQLQTDRPQPQHHAFAPERMTRIRRASALAKLSVYRLIAAQPFDRSDGDLVDRQRRRFLDARFRRLEAVGEVG